jgi:hypothetical protein
VAIGEFFADRFSRCFSLEAFIGYEIVVPAEPGSDKTPQATFALEASIGFSNLDFIVEISDVLVFAVMAYLDLPFLPAFVPGHSLIF